MNIEEYISSGILESYVLGITSEQENQKIEKLSKQYPEINAEILSIQNAMNTYALQHASAPPKYLKDKIISTIETVEEINHRKEDVKIIPKSKRGTDYKTLLAMAASLLLIISGIYLAKLITELNFLQTQLVALAEHNDSLSSVLINQQQQAETELALFKNPMSKMVKLNGTPKSPESNAMVIWNATSKEVYIKIEKLPDPPQDMQYQLWALDYGKPIDAGMIEITADNIGKMHKMKHIEQAQAFAITLEKKGGMPTPQGEMYAMGNI